MTKKNSKSLHLRLQCGTSLSSLSSLPPPRLQQDPSLVPSENSPDSSHQEHRHHPHLLPTSPRHLGSPEASDCSTETERRGTGASTPDISVSSDSEFESWDDGTRFGRRTLVPCGGASGVTLKTCCTLKTLGLSVTVDTLEVFSLGEATWCGCEWTLQRNDMQKQHALKKKAPWRMTLTVMWISLLLTMTQHC